MTFLSFYQFLLSILLIFEWKNVSQIPNHEKVSLVNGNGKTRIMECVIHTLYTQTHIYIYTHVLNIREVKLKTTLLRQYQSCSLVFPKALFFMK